MSPTTTLLAENYARDLGHWQAAAVFLDALHDEATAEADAEREWFAAVCAAVRAKMMAIAAEVFAAAPRQRRANGGWVFLLRHGATRGRAVPVDIVPGYGCPELYRIVNGAPEFFPLMPETIEGGLVVFSVSPFIGTLAGCRVHIGATRAIRMMNAATLYADEPDAA